MSRSVAVPSRGRVGRLAGCVGLILVLAIGFATPTRVVAEEDFMLFVERLRDREYIDYAIYYLDQLDKRSDVSAEFKQVIPYEKALTLMQGVRSLKNPADQSKQLDQARLLLDQFLKAHPKHDRAPQANTDLAQLLISKGRTELLQSKSPANAGTKGEFLAKARGFFTAARGVFQPAHDQYKAQWEKFPKFIDRAKDKSQYEDREKALVNYIQAQLNLAIVMYEEAQSYEADAPERKTQLTKAAEEFERIHVKYRSQIAGLYARMWQGKCFEEQQELTKALGIYDELLGHSGDAAALRRLQDHVLLFRLICLNHEKKNDHQLVVQEAQSWIAKSSIQSKQSLNGLGIQWQLALALEKLAAKQELAKEKAQNYNRALTIARDINRYAGEYKDVSTAMIQRLMGALNREPGDPKDFATAMSVAKDLVQQIGSKSAELAKAKGADADKLRGAYQAHLNETVRILKLTQALFTPKDEVAELNRSRYWLAVAYYHMKSHPLDAAVLGMFLAQKYRELDSDLALDGAYLSMASYLQLYAQKGTDDSQRFAIDKMIETCEFIAKYWPGSDKALDAWMNLGRLYSQIRQPEKAAEYFGKIPATSPQFLDAQLSAGQAFWQAYVDQVGRPEGERLEKAKLDDLQKKALDTLKQAVVKKEATQAPGVPDEALVSAKYSLVQILNASGNYKDALAQLTEGGFAIIPATAFEQKGDPTEGGGRPARGIKSKEFASAAYRELLRSYVGTQQLDKAREAMREMEKIEGAGGGGAAVTAIYVRLGQELEKEVRRLQSAKDARLGDVLKSFETFLEDVAKRTEGQDFYSLSWIAETYMALGEGLEDGDKTRSEGYFSKAAKSLQAIVDKGEKDSKFIPENGLLGTKLRMASCLRRQKAFDQAEKLVRELLAGNSKALDIQVEAASIYRDWADRGGPEDSSKWQLAIQGDPKDAKNPAARLVWGWHEISERLARSLQQATDEEKHDEYQKQYLEARYTVAESRLKLARSQTASAKKRQHLDAAIRDINMTASLSSSLSGGEAWERFNKLYRDVQKEIDPNAPVKDLAKRGDVAPVAAATPAKPDPTAVAKKAAAAAPKKAESTGGGWGMIVFVVVALAAMGGALYFLFQPKKRRVPVVAAKPSAQPAKPAAGGTGLAVASKPVKAAKPATAPRAPGNPAAADPSRPAKPAVTRPRPAPPPPPDE